jgi:hypothetical protein
MVGLSVRLREVRGKVEFDFRLSETSAIWVPMHAGRAGMPAPYELFPHRLKILDRFFQLISSCCGAYRAARATGRSLPAPLAKAGLKCVVARADAHRIAADLHRILTRGNDAAG